jgi:outer membrane receptor for ferrienterochelin and colicins
MVRGITLETRANYDGVMQLEGGFTVQSSLYDSPVENIEGLNPARQFLRTPDVYGYATWTFNPSDRLSVSVNYVHTGPMLLVHFAGAPEQREDAYVTTAAFNDLGFRAGYTFFLEGLGTGFELYGGIKNLTNAYQSDFDSGKNRDSNYIYGPGVPRTFFLGLRIRSL